MVCLIPNNLSAARARKHRGIHAIAIGIHWNPQESLAKSISMTTAIESNSDSDSGNKSGSKCKSSDNINSSNGNDI